ncbi:unnamed protein product [Mytilus edulis]|uniref:Uncharacterized protein n=1 Tax=Mytilus edulis TaxID=6550 RepID=A0A8S3R5U6_MYTED|nr:unnamed protein product [Mytilus edulis]
MLFDTGRQAGASFALFDEANSDLYFTLKNNLIGGPSIIFNRHHEVGQTFIRNDFTRPCQKILGFDANALYLYCIDQEMPTGSFVRRRVEDGFKPQKRDRDFVKVVSDNRRLGDADPDKAIIAETSKLEGNSGYGGTIMDQEKFQSVTYVQGEGRVMLEANKPQFKKLTTLLEQDEYFEVEKSKERLDINLPIQIGYFILQYSKLRMLEFYFDFLDVYVDRSDFEYCEMDTDSAYMALSGPKHKGGSLPTPQTCQEAPGEAPDSSSASPQRSEI